MNEQIKQLAKQALKHPDTDNDGLTVFDNDELEKFAELIVRECAKVCSKQAADWEGDYADAHNDGVESCISGIKEHFGVE